MALESGTYISDLVATNPAASDSRSQGDDHLRLIKSTVKNTFPNVAGAVTPTHTELNFVDGVTSAIQTQLDAKAPSASPTLTGDIELDGSVVGAVEVVGSGTTIDCSLANYFTKSMAANWTPTLSNIPAGAFGFVVEIAYTSGALTLPAGWEWAAGVAPGLSAGTYLTTWITSDGGTNGIVYAERRGV